MTSWYGLAATVRPRSDRWIGAFVSVLFLIVLLPGLASAQSYRAIDMISGDPTTTLEWSEGTWNHGSDPIPGCTTFPGGTDTSPGHLTLADSVACSAAPNAWHWSVTMPGPYTLQYDFAGIPPGITVCGQIFGVGSHMTEVTDMGAAVNLVSDWMVVTDLGSGRVLWAGSYSSFDPENAGFVPIAATRCGRYHTIPTGACCDLVDGTCLQLTEDDCANLASPHRFLGVGVACEPNPCPVPEGACCYPEGSCLITTQADCIPPGVWQGGATVCDPNPCPQPPPTGACCDLSTGICTVMTEDQCGQQSYPHQYLGDGTVCAPDNPCPQPTPTQKDTWGKIKSRYR
jgi:hypothetical protein